MFANTKSGLASMGIPLMGNEIPTFTDAKAKYYFVDGKYGSDSVAGTSPGKGAFSTIEQAITVMKARIS